jgi:hypothetical protein
VDSIPHTSPPIMPLLDSAGPLGYGPSRALHSPSWMGGLRRGAFLDPLAPSQRRVGSPASQARCVWRRYAHHEPTATSPPLVSGKWREPSASADSGHQAIRRYIMLPRDGDGLRCRTTRAAPLLPRKQRSATSTGDLLRRTLRHSRRQRRRLSSRCRLHLTSRTDRRVATL